MEGLDAVLTPKEVATALKLSEKSVVQYLREGRLPGFRVGKHWRVRGRDLAALVGAEPRPGLVLATDPIEPDEAPTAVAADTPSYDERKAVMIRRMQALKAAGLSHQKIADRLNVEREPTLSHKGTWKAGTVGKFLAEAKGETP